MNYGTVTSDQSYKMFETNIITETVIKQELVMNSWENMEGFEFSNEDLVY